MAATLGALSRFNQQQQTWEEDCGIRNHFFTANSITDEDEKKAVLLRSEQVPAESLMRNLLTPEKPRDKPF